MSTATEMRGPAGARRGVSEFLRSVLPSHLEACRGAWGLREAQLPAPVSEPDDPRKDAYFDREPANIDRWPLVAVTSARMTQRATDFSAAGDPMYQSTYPMRVYSWVKTKGFDATQTMRDDYGTAIRICALSYVNLADPSGRFTVVPSTVVMDFSAVAAVNGDRFVAGSYVGFDLRVTETLTDRLALPGGQPRDTVNLVTATGTPLPPHPALD